MNPHFKYTTKRNLKKKQKQKDNLVNVLGVKIMRKSKPNNLQIPKMLNSLFIQISHSFHKLRDFNE